jgi:hypothetical protein
MEQGQAPGVGPLVFDTPGETLLTQSVDKPDSLLRTFGMQLRS